MKDFHQIRQEMSKVNEATHLTMVTHDGEEHHVIHGMAHTQANADKVRNATAKAAAKHAGGGATHHDIKDGWDEGVHHEMSHSPHTDKKPATKGAARYGGHGELKIHKSVDAYVKHHAKADAHYHNQGEDYD